MILSFRHCLIRLQYSSDKDTGTVHWRNSSNAKSLWMIWWNYCKFLKGSKKRKHLLQIYRNVNIFYEFVLPYDIISANISKRIAVDNFNAVWPSTIHASQIFYSICKFIILFWESFWPTLARVSVLIRKALQNKQIHISLESHNPWWPWDSSSMELYNTLDQAPSS